MRPLRVATLEETLAYGGHDGLRRRGLLPPIAGAAGFSFVQGNKASTSTVTWPATPTVGNLLIAAPAAITNTTFTLAGWNALTSASTAGATARSLRLLWKIAGASEPSVAVTGAQTMAIAEYSPGGGTVNAPAENAVVNAAAAIQTTPSVTPTAGLLGLAVCVTMSRNAGTWSSQQVNSSATGVADREQITATQAALDLFDLVITSTSGAYSGQATTSAGAITGAGAIAVFTLAATATLLPGFERGRRRVFRGPTPSRGRF